MLNKAGFRDNTNKARQFRHPNPKNPLDKMLWWSLKDSTGQYIKDDSGQIVVARAVTTGCVGNVSQWGVRASTTVKKGLPGKNRWSTGGKRCFKGNLAHKCPKNPEIEAARKAGEFKRPVKDRVLKRIALLRSYKQKQGGKMSGPKRRELERLVKLTLYP